MAPQTAASLSPERRAELVKGRALQLGFDAAGVTDLAPVPHADSLDRWLSAGMAGTMAYMHRQAERRKNPAMVRPGLTRAVVFTIGYFLPDPDPAPGTGKVAKYARGTDYHASLPRALEQMAAFIRTLGNGEVRTSVYVDAGPVPERELAQRAGLGWIGKNTMLIDPRRGSYSFIGVVLTDLDLALDAPFEPDRCGSCTLCLEACPTSAFPEPRVLDATRCISYLTIEYRGPIPSELADRMGDWIFGCDACQDVCPWNEKFATPAGNRILNLNNRFARIETEEFSAGELGYFAERYGWTPLERPGPEGMQRNAANAAANARKEA